MSYVPAAASARQRFQGSRVMPTLRSVPAKMPFRTSTLNPSTVSVRVAPSRTK